MTRRKLAFMLLAAGLACLFMGSYLVLSEKVNRPSTNGAGGVPTREPQLPEVDDPWDVDRVSALAGRYEQADEEACKAMLPEVLEALRAYGKRWQGNEQKQLLFEASYLELASRLKAEATLGEDRVLADHVAEKCASRMKYVSDEEALQREGDRVGELLLAREYVQCRDKCARLIEDAFCGLPGMELALGISCLRTGDCTSALQRFRNVMEMCQGVYPDTAAKAAYLASCGLILRGECETAAQILTAIREDYPASSLGSVAEEMSARLGAALNDSDSGLNDTVHPVGATFSEKERR